MDTEARARDQKNSHTHLRLTHRCTLQAEEESFFAFYDEDVVGRFYFLKWVSVRATSRDAQLRDPRRGTSPAILTARQLPIRLTARGTCVAMCGRCGLASNALRRCTGSTART